MGRKNKMVGNVDQIKTAERIKERINAEFDRIAHALASSAASQAGQEREDIEAVIVILEEKRIEILAKGQADYFINSWREVSSRVRDLISHDPRYLAINTRKALRHR